MVRALSDIRRGVVSARVEAFVASCRRPLRVEGNIKPTKLFCTNKCVSASPTVIVACCTHE